MTNRQTDMHTTRSKGTDVVFGVPINVLPCEFTGHGRCDITFHTDDVYSWIEHITREHLRDKLPQKALCWFCDHFIFDSKNSQDLRTNFEHRMWHIRDHIIDEGKTANHMRSDHLLVQHLGDNQLIQRDANNFVHKSSKKPGFAEAPRDEDNKIHRQTHPPVRQPKSLNEVTEGPFAASFVPKAIPSPLPTKQHAIELKPPPKIILKNYIGPCPAPESLNPLPVPSLPMSTLSPSTNPADVKNYNQMTKSEKMSHSMKARWASGSMSQAVQKRRAALTNKKQVPKVVDPEQNLDSALGYLVDSHPDESSCLEPEEYTDTDEDSQGTNKEREETRKPPIEQDNKVKMVVLERLALSNSEFDSGYRSMSVAKQTLDSVNEIEPSIGQDLVYSEAGSLDRRTDNYAQYLADEVIAKLKIELKDADWDKCRADISDSLREFAIRVGSEGETQNHRDLMYWTHKWHEDIVKHIEKRQTRRDYDDEDERRKKEGDPDWRDRVNMLFNRDDQNVTRDTSEGNPLTPIEIEVYQQIISRSQAFEWLLSSIRNSVVLGTVKGNAMDTVKQEILQKLKLHDQQRGDDGARISRHRNPARYRACFRLDWPSGRSYQDGNSFKILSDVFERVLTISGDSTRAQALLCEDYIRQTWPSTGPLLVQAILKALNRGNETKELSVSLQEQVSLIKVQISGEVMQVYRQGNAFELAEIGAQLAWLVCALLPQPKINQGIISKPRVWFNRPKSRSGIKHGGECEDFCCHLEVATTSFDLRKAPSMNGSCWQTIMSNFVIVDGFPIRSRPSGKPGLDIPLGIAANFVGTRQVTRFKGRPLIKGFSTLLCPISWEDGVVYWHVLKSEIGRISFADMRIESMSTIKSGSLKLRDLENSRHVVGWCTEVEQLAGTIDANLDIRRTDLKQPPNEWTLKEIQVGGGQYINVLATFVVRKDQKSLQIKRDRSDYSGNMEWIAKRHVILHDTQSKERRAWLIDGASALLYLVFMSLQKDLHGVLPDSYTFNFGQLKEFLGSRPSGTAASLSVLMNTEFLSTRLRGRDPMNPSNWYLLRDRVDEIFDLLAQMIDHQGDIDPCSGLGHFVFFSPWKQHVGWNFADIASPREPCNLKATYLEQHGEGWAYFARELHAVTLFGHGFGDLLRPPTLTPNPCNHCFWGSLAPKGGDILAVSLEALKSHLNSSGQRRVETRCILSQRLSPASPDNCFRPCSRDNCVSQRIHTFHRVSGKGYDPLWEDAHLPEMDEGYLGIGGAALLGVRPRVPPKWIGTRRKRNKHQPDGVDQSRVDTDEVRVVDGGSISTTQSSSLGTSHDSIQMTSIQGPSTPGSSALSRQPDSTSAVDEAMGNTPREVSRENPFRRIQEGTHDWVHRLRFKRPRSTY